MAGGAYMAGKHMAGGAKLEEQLLPSDCLTRSQASAPRFALLWLPHIQNI